MSQSDYLLRCIRCAIKSSILNANTQAYLVGSADGGERLWLYQEANQAKGARDRGLLALIQYILGKERNSHRKLSLESVHPNDVILCNDSSTTALQ